MEMFLSCEMANRKSAERLERMRNTEIQPQVDAQGRLKGTTSLGARAGPGLGTDCGSLFVGGISETKGTIFKQE